MREDRTAQHVLDILERITEAMERNAEAAERQAAAAERIAAALEPEPGCSKNLHGLLATISVKP